MKPSRDGNKKPTLRAAFIELKRSLNGFAATVVKTLKEQWLDAILFFALGFYLLWFLGVL